MKKVENKAECDQNNKYTIHCTNPNCKFDLGLVKIIDAVFQISMNGGYVQFDGESKLNIECPDCHEETVVVE